MCAIQSWHLKLYFGVHCAGEETYQAPAPGQVDVKVDLESSRLQILEPFNAWDGKDIEVPRAKPPACQPQCPRVPACHAGCITHLILVPTGTSRCCNMSAIAVHTEWAPCMRGA